MVVIADTSPLNYLVLVGHIDLLRVLYSRIVVPEGVLKELRRPSTPRMVAEWISSNPSWLAVEPEGQISYEPDLDSLGSGERQAIGLAQASLPDVLLVIDEGKGRRAVRQRRIPIIGTLGVLEIAAAQGRLDLPRVLTKLQQTSFYVTPSLIGLLLERDRKRKSRAEKIQTTD